MVSPNTSIIGCDAFLGPRTVNWAVNIGRTRVKVFKYLTRRPRAKSGEPDKWFPIALPEAPKDGGANEFYPYEPMLNMLCEALKRDEDVYAFFLKVTNQTIGKTGDVDLDRTKQHRIIMFFLDEIKRRTDIGEDQAKTMSRFRNDFPNLANPVGAWEGLRALLNSPTAGIGLNYDTPNHFNAVYTLTSRHAAPTREMLQGIWRVRHPVTGNIYVFTENSKGGGGPSSVHRVIAEMKYDLREQLVLGERLQLQATSEDIRSANSV